MSTGTLFGIGVGPGDPELLTVKGARLLASCDHLFVPKPADATSSVSLEIVRNYVKDGAVIHEVIFPMTKDPEELARRWDESAARVARVLQTGADVCYLTLGDTFLYSTYIYLVRALRRRLPDVNVVTVPGVSSFSAAAALAEFPLGEGNEPVTVIPTGEDLGDIRKVLAKGGTAVLMKIGKRLKRILGLLENVGAIDRGVFVSRAGMQGERVEKDLRRLAGDAGDGTGNLSVILVRGKTADRKKEKT
jgi:precorrin-2/cobalt-factor-2 C20-methyltransferase